MKRKSDKLSAQVKRKLKAKEEPNKNKPYKGNTEIMLSTGSTLLDLAISGHRKRGGGVPGGIIIEAFGPPGSGKTVFLMELAGAVQRAKGSTKMNDPEDRLSTQFASIFDYDVKKEDIETPDTVTEMIQNIKDFETDGGPIHGFFTDSIAALSTNLEMDNADGDKMGTRRAKEFSEGLRKIARILKPKNIVLACSNQIRTNVTATHGEKFTTPGGHAFDFYASLRLRFFPPQKITKKKTVHGKEASRVVATMTKVYVYKNSVDAPYREAPVYIQFDYGIDDIRANLQYVKDYTKNKTYTVNGENLSNSMEEAINKVESEGLEDELKEEVIDLWEFIQDKLKFERKKKER